MSPTFLCLYGRTAVLFINSSVQLVPSTAGFQQYLCCSSQCACVLVGFSIFISFLESWYVLDWKGSLKVIWSNPWCFLPCGELGQQGRRSATVTGIYSPGLAFAPDFVRAHTCLQNSKIQKEILLPLVDFTFGELSLT